MSNPIPLVSSGITSTEAPENQPTLGIGHADITLHFDNIHNMRDLGGLPSQDGRRISTHRLFRSGNPGMASSRDIDRLRTLGIDIVIDFRSTGEKSDEEKKFGEIFNWVAMPILEGSMNMSELVPRLKKSTRQDVDDFMLEVYRDFPTKYQSVFRHFMKVAETGQTLLYHCSAGKDRTGFATFLLLSALDVAPDLIYANYLESNRGNGALVQRLLTHCEMLGIAPEVAMPLLEVQPYYLQASLQVIQQEWGNTANFLNQALAVDIEQLRTHYLERAN